jgi:predicted nuclease of predicted toxin-antitoxin system
MNISPLTVNALRVAGYDICRVSEILPQNAADHTILTYSRKHDCIIITQDLDFSALLAIGRHANPSVISLRMSSTDPNNVTKKLLFVIPRYDMELKQGCAISVEDDFCRIRILPIK